MDEPFKNISKTRRMPPWGRERIVPLQSPHTGSLLERKVIQAGVREIRGPRRFDYTGTGFHMLIYTSRGRVRLEHPRLRQTISEDELWLVPGGSEYKIELGRGAWECFWFHIRSEGRWEALAGRKPNRIDPGWPERTRWAMETIAVESLYWVHPDSPGMIRACAEVIGLYIDRRLGIAIGPRSARLHDRLAGLWGMVNEDLSHKWRTKDLADALHVSQAQLHRYSQSCYGTSPMAMVTSLRMRRAEELLLNTDLSVQHISKQIGYETPFALSKAFKRQVGCSPRAFRAKGKKVIDNRRKTTQVD